MKKLKFLVTLFIAVLFIAGCGTSDAEKLLDEAIENLKNIKSGTVSLETVIGTDDGNIRFNIDATAVEEKGMHAEIKMNLFGMMSEGEEMYAIVRDGKFYSYEYDSTEDKWFYSVDESMRPEDFSLSKLAEEFENETDTKIFEEFEKYAKQYDSVKKVSSEDSSMTKLEVTYSKKTIEKWLEEAGMPGDTREEFKKETGMELDEVLKDFIIHIYVKNGHIAKIQLDLSSFTKDIKIEDFSGFTKFDVIITFTDINELSEIKVPSDILDNAIDYDAYWDEYYSGW